MASTKNKTPRAPGGSKRVNHPTVAALKSKGVERSVRIVGYPHEASSPDRLRIYLSLEDLSTYLEVLESGILHEEAPQDPLDATVFYLSEDTPITYSQTVVAAAQATFLDGTIASVNMKTAGELHAEMTWPTGSWSPICMVRPPRPPRGR